MQIVRTIIVRTVLWAPRNRVCGLQVELYGLYKLAFNRHSLDTLKQHVTYISVTIHIENSLINLHIRY